jgi:hypothetical protein
MTRFFLLSEDCGFVDVDLFPSSGEGRETHTLLGPLEIANLSHWKPTYMSKSKLCYDRQLVGQSVLVSGTHLWFMIIFVLLSDS